MVGLHVIKDITTNSLNITGLDLISIFSILSGVLVIISKNPVVSVLFLIGLFLTIACYLMMLGINFIGLSYLLVYVGAVSILFLFILMLINVRVSELVLSSGNSIPLGIMTGVLFSIGLSEVFTHRSSSYHNTVQSASGNLSYATTDVYNSYTSKLYYVTSQIWDGMLAEKSHITSIGNIIYTNFPMWLILTSIILLLSMIGSILITIKQ